MSDNDLFYHMSMIINVDQAEIAKIVNDYIERNIGCGTVYDRLNCPKPPIYIKPVKLMTLRDRIIEESTKELQNKVDKLILKEETKMNATSTENFKDIIAIDFELQTFPNPDTQDKFILSATNRDDIFCFVFEGPYIVDACRKAGLFCGWEKDQKIRKLEKELSEWKKEAEECLKLRDEAQKEAYKLKKENEKYEEKIKKLEHDDMLDKNAADYWSKEHDILLERFAKLQVENEELKELKTPTIENFADEGPADNVNHPSHYTGRYECIDVMQDVFGDEATDNFCLCNAFKYIWRARKKNGLEDVKKAVWYLNKYIEEAENGFQKGEQI